MKAFLESVLNDTLIKNKTDNDDFFNFTGKFGIVQLVAKRDMVLSGTSPFDICLNHIDPDVHYEEYFTDGQEILQGQSVFQLDGNLISMLKFRATGLSLLELFSGIATQTRKFVKACQGSRTKIVNHCRVVPGYGPWYKKAMKDGGAVEYSPDLKDCFTMDQNYIYVAGGLKQAVTGFRHHGHNPVSVEVKNTEEIKMACELGVDLIKFENEIYPFIREKLNLIPKSIKTEVYSRISVENVPEIMEHGVDFINLESLTHGFDPVNFELIFDGGC